MTFSVSLYKYCDLLSPVYYLGVGYLVMFFIFQIDALEDMLVHQQRLKVYEMLQHGVGLQVC